MTYHRYLGVCLGGGKSDRTSLAVLDYYPEHKKLLLSTLFETIEGDEKRSADTVLIDLVKQNEDNLRWIAMDVALGLPQCLTCRLKCPGVEECHQPHIEWMWNHFRRRRRENKNVRLFTPYTERCVEFFAQTEMEEPFYLQSALGANMAPLTARAHFLLRRLPKNRMIEVAPEVSFWRLAHVLEVPGLRRPRQSRDFEEDELRHRFLAALLKDWPLFVYQQDIQRMTDNFYALDAFLAAITAFLKDQGETEKRPRGFPKGEAWVEFPLKNFRF